MMPKRNISLTPTVSLKIFVAFSSTRSLYLIFCSFLSSRINFSRSYFPPPPPSPSQFLYLLLLLISSLYISNLPSYILFYSFLSTRFSFPLYSPFLLLLFHFVPPPPPLLDRSPPWLVFFPLLLLLLSPFYTFYLLSPSFVSPHILLFYEHHPAPPPSFLFASSLFHDFHIPLFTPNYSLHIYLYSL